METIGTVPEAILSEFRSLPRQFFGSIEVTYQNGEPTIIRVNAVKKFDKNNHQMRGDRINAQSRTY